MLNIGSQAPDFSLPDGEGKVHSLADYAGGYVLLYFYPKDETPGCTKEACAIRDAFEEFTRRGIVVLGVSRDSVESHKKFAQKHDLPFTLLSDGGGETVAAYGGGRMSTAKRISYLIGPGGIIVKVYPSVYPAAHAAQILSDFDGMQEMQVG